MVNNSETKHYHPVELTNEQRLEVAEMLTSLKDIGLAPVNQNLGQFITTCFFRGLNDYRKDLVQED